MDDRMIKEAYCVFQQPWWLDAVCPNGWHETTVEEGGRIVGRLPFVVRRRAGLTLLTAPPLTPRLGPWISEDAGTSRWSRLTSSYERMTALLGQLPASDGFDELCCSEMPPPLPFHWAGHSIEVRYSYRLDGGRAGSEIWPELRSTVRTQVRKDQRRLSVRDDLSIDTFLRVWSLTFARQNLKPPYPPSLIARIIETARARHAGVMTFAVGADGAVHAVVFVVHDQAGAFLLLQGADPALRASGGSSLLIWDAVERLAPTVPYFDFEGSMIEPIEAFYRSFGGVPVPYLCLRRSNWRLNLLRSAMSPLRRLALGRP